MPATNDAIPTIARPRAGRGPAPTTYGKHPSGLATDLENPYRYGFRSSPPPDSRIAKPASWPQRKTIRLAGYDYSAAGCYFVTICTADRKQILGRVIEAGVELWSAGAIAERVWRELPDFYPNLVLDSFILMPNHVHAVLALHQPRPTPEFPRPRRLALSEIVRGFKSMSAREINRGAKHSGAVWQRGFYEHVVRNEADLYRIREYIDNNPIVWTNDPENPERRPET